LAFIERENVLDGLCLVLAQGPRLLKQIHDSRHDLHRSDAGIDVDGRELRVSEYQWDVEVGDVGVIVRRDTTVLDQGDTMVTHHHDQSFIGHAGLFQDLGNFTQPFVIHSDCVEVFIDSAVVVEQARVDKFFVLVTDGHIPRVVGLTGQVGDENTFVLLFGMLEGMEEVVPEFVFRCE
jgi:hypothetical protein